MSEPSDHTSNSSVWLKFLPSTIIMHEILQFVVSAHSSCFVLSRFLVTNSWVFRVKKLPMLFTALAERFKKLFPNVFALGFQQY